MAELFRNLAVRNALVLRRFVRLYGLAVLVLVVSAVLAWIIADSVSDYTHRGWEMHIIQPNLGVNLHFHHWYYGVPLGLLAFLLLDVNATLSVFIFGLGQSLAAHSFLHEGGIPSLIEGGTTLRVPGYLYFPVVTAIAMLYMFFVMRREEWLAMAREREEVAVSYFSAAEKQREAVAALDGWAEARFRRARCRDDRATGIRTGQYSRVTFDNRDLWSLEYASTPYDDGRHILVVRLQHTPFRHESTRLLDWLNDLHRVMAPHVEMIAGTTDIQRSIELGEGTRAGQRRPASRRRLTQE